MGGECRGIIGSILCMIVIVGYGKVSGCKEEKGRKRRLKGVEVVKGWSMYVVMLLLIVVSSGLFGGLGRRVENNWVRGMSVGIND